MAHDPSMPHLSIAGPPAPAQPEPASERYVEIGQLGQGGMGVVHAVHDAHLNRQVARKRPRADVPGADDALRREARLIATLEHPGIVAVYDTGADARGQPWYTMPVIRGRSLRAVVAHTPDPARRVALLPQCLGAIQAVAYAHARGVVHRDLKASNVLLGEHGEVQVVDWGLASEGPRAGGGTPTSMAPEQARGEPATARSDVWALGLLVREVLTGAPPGEPGADALPAGTPRDLAAVVARCLRPSPADRYADAGALAADLARFLDGRLVEAHDYSPVDHATRFVARQRVPLAVAALALIAVTGVAVAAAIGTSRERDAARAAESRAQAALARSDASLADALTLAAQVAAAEGARPEAELLAAHALTLAESPAARGVLASFGGARPTRTPGVLPRCDGELAQAGALSICAGADALTAWDGDRLAWRAAPARSARIGARGVWVATGPRAVALLDATDGRVLRDWSDLYASTAVRAGERGWVFVNERLFALDPDRADAVESAPCGTRILADLAEIPSGALVGCGSPASLVWVDAAGATTRELSLPFSAPTAYPAAIAVSGGGRIAVGSQYGELLLVGTDESIARTDVGRPVRAARWTADGERVLVDAYQSGVSVFDGVSAAPYGRLPRAAGPVVGLHGPDGLVTADGARWSFAGAGVSSVGRGSGLTDVLAVAPADLVMSRGDGQVIRFDARTGRERARTGWGPATVKAVAPWSDGFAATGVQDGVWALTPDLRERVMLQPMRGRRLVALGDHLLHAGYIGSAERIGRGRVEPAWASEVPAFDLDVSPDGRIAVALDADGALWRVPANGAAESIGRLDAVAVAIHDDGAVLAVARGRYLAPFVGTPGEPVALPGITPLDVERSPDGRIAAIASIDGRLLLVESSTGAVLAVHRAHAERIARVAFDGDDRLWSASWDETARPWDLTALTADPAARVAALEAAWGLDLDAALDVGAP